VPQRESTGSISREWVARQAGERDASRTFQRTTGFQKGVTVDKKASSSTSTTANSDSYWLACIARNNQDAMAAKAQRAAAVANQSIENRVVAERPATTDYPRKPADSFWLKQADAQHANSVAVGAAEAAVAVPQGNTRVGIPPHIVYTAIIDDGKTHHVAWGIRNMSLSGVLLDMNVRHLREGMTVDFLLRCTLKGRTVDRRIPAKVVRTQLNGLALQFINYDTSTCHELVGLLYSA
jgi:hypothetical protein